MTPDTDRTRPGPDTSPQATSIARALDRLKLPPGRYTVTIDVPAKAHAWRVTIHQATAIRTLTTAR